jgi:hypothetical protein
MYFTFAIFLKDFSAIKSLLSITKRTLFFSIQMFFKTEIALFVFISFTSNASNHIISLSFAFNDISQFIASLLAFLFIDFEKFLFDLGPKATHHHFLIGDLFSHALAFQVHFCLNNFLFDQATSHLVFV